MLAKAQKICFSLYLVSLVTSMSGMELFGYLFIFLVGIDCLKDKTWEWPYFIKPLLAFSGVVVLGILLGDSSWHAKGYDLARLRFFLLPLFIFIYLKKQSDYEWIWKTLFAACVVVAIYGSIQHFFSVDWIRPEGKKVLLFAIPDQKIGLLVVGFFNHHLTFANVFTFYACLFFALRKWPYVLMGSYLFLLCIWTQSRAAWAAIPVCLLFLIVKVSKPVRIGAVALLAFFFVATYFADAGFKQRFDRTVFQKDDFYNLGPRTRLWRAQWEIFKDHPILGVGYNNNERLAKTYVDKLYPDRTDNFYGHAHNTPLQILATTGLLGSLAYLWLWGTIFGGLYKKRSWGLIAAFAAFQIQGLTQWNFGDAEVLHSLMFFWALAACDVSKHNVGGLRPFPV